MSADILGTSWDRCRSTVQYSLTSTETRRLVRTEAQDGRLDSHTAPELWRTSRSQLAYVICAHSLQWKVTGEVPCIFVGCVSVGCMHLHKLFAVWWHCPASFLVLFIMQLSISALSGNLGIISTDCCGLCLVLYFGHKLKSRSLQFFQGFLVK